MKIIISQGDANGIGLEVGIKALRKYFSENNAGTEFALAANPDTLSEYLKKIGENCAIRGGKLVLGSHEIEIVNCETYHAPDFGKTSALAGKLAGEAIDRAIDATLAGKFDALLTLPINKEAMNLGGYHFTGHTEFLGAKCGATPLMILSDARTLSVALATIHEPIARVAALITPELLEKRLSQIIHTVRQDFGIAEPRIAVLSLNPHAGENGMLGTEENEIIRPTIAKFAKNAAGAFPSDAFFCRRDYEKFDAVLAMYHDQGLIPLKMLAGAGGVNFSAELPIVRTSPDHGTGFDIAGKGIADCTSTLDAVRFAENVVMQRRKCK